MILKPGPLFPSPGRRIDGVIYFFGVPSVSQPLTIVGWDESVSKLFFWDGDSLVDCDLLVLVAGLYPAGDGQNITGILGINVDPDFGAQDIKTIGVGNVIGVPNVDPGIVDFLIASSGASRVALAVEGATGQTFGIFQVLREDGAVIFTVGPDFGFASGNFSVDATGQVSTNNQSINAGSGVISGDGSGLTNLPAQFESGSALLDGSGSYTATLSAARGAAVASWAVGSTPTGQLQTNVAGTALTVVSSLGAADAGQSMSWIAS